MSGDLELAGRLRAAHLEWANSSVFKWAHVNGHDLLRAAEALEAAATRLEGLRDGVTDPLFALIAHPNWEIDTGYDGPNEDYANFGWRVHEVSGNKNDLEWTLIGFGETPHAAITAALKSPDTETLEALGKGLK